MLKNIKRRDSKAAVSGMRVIASLLYLDPDPGCCLFRVDTCVLCVHVCVCVCV
jgi:hypothetical protein